MRPDSQAKNTPDIDPILVSKLDVTAFRSVEPCEVRLHAIKRLENWTWPAKLSCLEKNIYKWRIMAKAIRNNLEAFRHVFVAKQGNVYLIRRTHGRVGLSLSWRYIALMH